MNLKIFIIFFYITEDILKNNMSYMNLVSGQGVWLFLKAEFVELYSDAYPKKLLKSEGSLLFQG